MAISLKKNSSISLTKSVDSELTKITLGLGWDPVKKSGFFGSLFGGGGGSIDLDASCLLLDKDGNLVDKVWFQKLSTKCKSVRHQGDNLTGDGDGDDEKITVNLKKLPAATTHLALVVNSFRGQSFNQVENAFCRVLDQSNKEVCRFTLNEQGNHTGTFIALVSRNNNEWTFASKGIPATGRTVDDMLPYVKENLG
ncbi:TerD family protein [Vibrio sp. Of7-15]|uniref:TerD family protein n=1 Tax=Vibrio sp. Of7-15 TaxID=2724879 RepID=UPI001EF1CBA2|nr:TerD family protein [Vibrio sp. Of7-15]MCG7498072.1 TerD family protein [Vibrio sp. Of7-15]